MSSTGFFIASKLVWALIQPGTWLIAGLAFAAVALMRGHVRAGRRMVLAILAAMLAIAVLPLGDLALRPLELRHPRNPDLTRVDGIVILGFSNSGEDAAHWGQVPLSDAAERLTEGLTLARRFPNAKVIFTGGVATLRDPEGESLTPDAEGMGRILTGLGLSSDRLILEPKARNTRENAARALPLAAPKEGETWVLVTSAFHMPRAMESFARAGWPEMIAYPVDFRSSVPGQGGLSWGLIDGLAKLDTALREYVGLWAYRLTAPGGD